MMCSCVFCICSVESTLVLNTDYNNRHQTTTDEKGNKYRYSNSTDGISNYAFIANRIVSYLLNIKSFLLMTDMKTNNHLQNSRTEKLGTIVEIVSAILSIYQLLYSL